jgi:hypothetical protein
MEAAMRTYSQRAVSRLVDVMMVISRLLLANDGLSLGPLGAADASDERYLTTWRAR